MEFKKFILEAFLGLLIIKTLRSFFFNNHSSFQKTNQLPFEEKAWLHSYGRNASNVHLAKIGLLKDKIMKKLLDGIQEIHFRSIPGTSDNQNIEKLLF